MKKYKRLFVLEQFKRKGFLLFLSGIFFFQTLYVLYHYLKPPETSLVFEALPDHFITRDSTIKRPETEPPTLPAVVNNKRVNTAIASNKTPHLDVNSAVASQFQKIYGIGPVYSKRIVKFRNSVGGFMHMDQLYDVYGLDSSVVKALKLVFSVQKRPIVQQLSVNQASAYELQNIPFLNQKMALEIVNKRDREGLFNNFEELLNILRLPPYKIEIIKLYLTF